jgi:integrase
VKRIRGRFVNLLSRQLVEIDERAVTRWWQERTTGANSAARATAARDLASLSSALSKATEWKLIETQPIAGFRQRETQPRTIVRYLSASEETRLRDALLARDARLISARDSANAWRTARGMPTMPSKQGLRFADHLSPVVCLALNTGLRRGELLSLTWRDVDLDARMLTVRAANAKSGKQRHVPLNTEAFSVMTAWAAQSVKGATVFNVASVKNSWGNVVSLAALKGFRFHDLRHHFASKLVAKGVDLNTVRELLGHADLKMTLRYAHLAPEHLAAAVAKL